MVKVTVVNSELEEELHARRSDHLPDVFGSKDWGGPRNMASYAEADE
jgi:hypothetical protein